MASRQRIGNKSVMMLGMMAGARAADPSTFGHTYEFIAYDEYNTNPDIWKQDSVDTSRYENNRFLLDKNNYRNKKKRR